MNDAKQRVTSIEEHLSFRAQERSSEGQIHLGQSFKYKIFTQVHYKKGI